MLTEVPKQDGGLSIGELLIEQHQFHRVQLCKGFARIGCLVSLHAPLFQKAAQHVPVQRVVLHHQCFQPGKLGATLIKLRFNRGPLQRQGEMKGRALARNTVYPHPPLHDFDEPFADRQAKTGAAVLSRNRIIRLGKILEESMQFLRWNANSSVTDCNMDLRP